MSELETVEFITTNTQEKQPDTQPLAQPGTQPVTQPHQQLISESRLRVQQIRDHFGQIALATIIYAVFYTFCLYKNLTGITFPLFVGGTYGYLLFCMKTLSISRKKDAVFYIGCSLLLGISTFCTDSVPIQIFNFIGILLLIGSFMVHQTYEDNRWNFSKYLGTVFYTAISAIAYVFQPFLHFDYFLKHRGRKSSGKGKYVWYGIFITIPLLLVVLALLASADVVFGRLLEKLFRFGDIVPGDFFGILFLTIFAFFAAYAYLCATVSRDLTEEVTDKRTGEPIIAITFTSVLTMVYLVFSLIQIVYLFIGGMQIPEGYSYAQYARQGYFQLLFVCLINLVLVLVCLRRFKEHKVLKGILLVLSACTYIMIASSVYRMLLYVNVYCLTFTRVLVLWSLAVLTVLLTGIVISIFKPVFPLFRYCMIVVTCAYLCLSFSHQDYWITKYNLVSAERNTAFVMDYDYLHRLSADKISAMITYMDADGLAEYEKEYRETLRSEGEEAGSDMKLRTWNLSRYLAYQAVQEL